MNTQLNDLWRDFWDARNPRERLLLGWGGAIAAAALAYSVLWAPAAAGCARLERELPEMRHALARMTAQADEARMLSSAAQGIAPTGAALRDALATSLEAHGLGGAQLQVAGSGVQLQLKNAAFPAWVTWLDEARKQFKVKVGEAHVTGLATAGQVDLTAQLLPAQTQ
jgi:general secretion pathway protein M